MNRTNLNKANYCQPDSCKQASMPKSSHKNVDSTFFKQDKKKLRPPDKKNIDSHLSQIKLKEKELKNCYTEARSIRQEMKTLQPNRYMLIEEKKKNNLELKTLREEIFIKNNNLSRLQSVLTYKNEHKINEAIKKLELQLSCNTFKLREKKKINAEIDSLKGSKKSLVNYLAQKKEIDELREQQLKKRKENEQYHRQVSMLISKEDEMRFRLHILQTTIDGLHLELNGLNEQKKFLLSDYKRREKDHNIMKDAIRKKNRQNSKHKEEEKPSPIHRNHSENFQVFPTPEEECLQHCNILINYLQQFPVADIGQTSYQVPSPKEETAAASSGPASEIQGEQGTTCVLLKKNDESEQFFFGAGRRQNKKIKRGRRLSATKPLPHSQEILAQFENLQISAPSGFAEIPSALKMLEEKKEYFEFLIQQGEEGFNQSPKEEEEAPVEQDDVCLSDSGYSADGSAACELSRQVSHTESIEGSPSNINLLEMISLMNAETIRNDQPCWSSSSSSSSSSSDEDDDILQDIGNGFQKMSNVPNTPTPFTQGQSADSGQLLPQNELRVSELDRKETTQTADGQSKATAALLGATLPNNPQLGMLNLKLASMISRDSCAEETQPSEDLYSKRPAEILITNCRETNGNSSSCSSSSSSSSNCNDDLSDRRSKSSRNFLNVVKSKRVRNISPTTDISCDLKGMQYEALASPSGLRFTNRSAPEPSGACESSSEDEERSVNVETIEEEAEEEDYEVAEPVAEEEDEYGEEDEDEEEEEEEEEDDNDEGEMEGRRLEEDLTDNSDSEKDNETSAMRGYSESGDDNTDDDNDKKLEDEEQAS